MKSLVLPIIFVLSCATAPVAVHSAAPPMHGAVHWFEGSVEDGFALAKSQHKAIFLYWGAVWCPPCNVIKSTVFTSPEVGKLLDTVVTIYLDGDTDRAQVWADKLKVSGYPSLLLLDENGAELTRLGEFVDATEFISAITGALAMPNGRAERIANGTASHMDWMAIAYSSPDATAGLKNRLTAFDHMPTSEVDLRAVVAAKLLESAADSSTPEDASAVRAKSEVLLAAMFASDESAFAARSTIVGSSKEVLTWLYPKADDPALKPAAEKWVTAAQSFRWSDKVSPETRLLSAAPVVELWPILHAGQPLSPEVLADVHEAVKQADANAKTAYERHAIISDAAELLGDAGDVDGARALLVHEQKITDTPWYYQSSLAKLELKAGKNAAALDWSARARESAQGKATRLQWLVADLLLNAKVDDDTRPQRVADLLARYYDLAWELPDGFSGRNATRARTVVQNLDSWKWPPVLDVVSRYRAKCPSAAGCQVAFPPGQ